MKLTKTVAALAFTNVLRMSDPAYMRLIPQPGISRLYPVCVGRAHYIIKSGAFSDNDCSDTKFKEAVKAVEGVKSVKNKLTKEKPPKKVKKAKK